MLKRIREVNWDTVAKKLVLRDEQGHKTDVVVPSAAGQVAVMFALSDTLMDGADHDIAWNDYADLTDNVEFPVTLTNSGKNIHVPVGLYDVVLTAELISTGNAASEVDAQWRWVGESPRLGGWRMQNRETHLLRATGVSPGSQHEWHLPAIRIDDPERDYFAFRVNGAVVSGAAARIRQNNTSVLLRKIG